MSRRTPLGRLDAWFTGPKDAVERRFRLVLVMGWALVAAGVAMAVALVSHCGVRDVDGTNDPTQCTTIAFWPQQAVNALLVVAGSLVVAWIASAKRRRSATK